MVLFWWFSGCSFAFIPSLAIYAPHLYTTILGVCTCIVGSSKCSGCMVYDPINSAMAANFNSMNALSYCTFFTGSKIMT